MQTVIGLVGEKGAGKDTFVQILQKKLSSKNIAHIRFSDHFKETLKIWSIPITRDNLQKLGVIMSEGYGSSTVSDAVFSRIKNLKADIVCLDGVRWKSDVELVRIFPKNFLVYITANPNLRFKRLKQRGEKVDEINLTFTRFMKEEKAKNEILIPKFGMKADFKILNEGTLEEFEQKVDKFIQKTLKLFSFPSGT
jgi:dephospho-CoA kinase